MTQAANGGVHSMNSMAKYLTGDFCPLVLWNHQDLKQRFVGLNSVCLHSASLQRLVVFLKNVLDCHKLTQSKN